MLSLERKTRGASVPLPKTIIRYILNAVLPRVLQRKLLGALPPELGQYLLEAGQGARLAGKPLHSGVPVLNASAYTPHPDPVMLHGCPAYNTPSSWLWGLQAGSIKPGLSLTLCHAFYKLAYLPSPLLIPCKCSLTLETRLGNLRLRALSPITAAVFASPAASSIAYAKSTTTT